MSHTLTRARPHPRAHLLALALSGAALLAPTVTLAATAPKPAANKKVAKVIFLDSSSSETPAARKKRLKIECKGRPNAGACLGLTR